MSEDRSSNRTSDLTALPRWESFRTNDRPRLHIPLPALPKRAHARKDSRTPILDKDVRTSDLDNGEGSKSYHLERIESRAITPVEKRKPRYSRTTLWLVAMLIVVLIVIIVLGAVLGKMAHRRSTVIAPTVTEIPADTTPTPTTSFVATVPSQTIAPTHRVPSVAVTGYNVPGSRGYNSVWLFWQDSQGYLSYAAYNSSTGNWTRVTNFAEARKDTPLAASVLNTDWYKDQKVSVLH